MIRPNGIAPRPGPLPQHATRALAHMRRHMQDSITLTELAAASGISERALLRQFERFLGVSPMAHLKRMRLNAAHSALQQSDPGTTISDIAGRCGFTHLGRFATEYHKAFGQLPSVTLRHKPQDSSHAGNGARASVAMPFTTRLLPSLLVLPLRTETLEERRVAQELMELVTATLSRTRVANVTFADPMLAVSRQLARAPKQRTETEYCMHGRVVRRNEQARVTLWLMDGLGRHVWGDSYDGQADDLFDLLQRAAGSALCGVVRGIAGAELDRIRSKDPHALAARETILRAAPVWLKIDVDSSCRAFTLATRAMQMDPDDALPVAVAAYAQARLLNGAKVDSPDATRRLASDLSCRAAALDEGDPVVVTARAAVATLLNASEEVYALVDRALAMDPTSGWAWERKGFQLCWDRPDEAIPCFNRALQLYGPHIPRDNCFLGIGQAHIASARIPEAISWMHKTLVENPRAHLPVARLICLEEGAGRVSAARQWADHLNREHPDLTRAQLTRLYPTECFDRLVQADVFP